MIKSAKIAIEKIENKKNSGTAADLGLSAEDLKAINDRLAGNTSTAEEKEVDEFYHVDTCTPLLLDIFGVDGYKLAFISYLCKDNDKDELFVLYHNYILENDKDVETIKKSVLYSSNRFISDAVVTNTLIKNLRSFVTELDYIGISIKDDNARKDDAVFCIGYDTSKDNTPIKFYMNADVFVTLGFIEMCTIEGLDGEANMAGCVMCSSDKRDTNSEFVIINDIEEIVDIAKDKRSTKTKTPMYYVVYKVKNPFGTAADDEYIFIRDYISSDKKLSITTKSDVIEKLYGSHENQYFALTFFDCDISDDPYTVYKISNKMGGSKVLLFSEEVYDKLTTMIEDK